MIIRNLTNPGAAPVNGDRIRIEYGNGTIEEKLYWTPPPPPEPTADQLRAVAKAARAQRVAAIKVTTAAGHTFDGDETSQGRMARAIIALGTGLAPSVSWVLADNTVIDATREELTEALVLAGQAQAALWVLPS